MERKSFAWKEKNSQKTNLKDVKKQVTNNNKPTTQQQTPQSYTVYTVKSGDNLWIIAKKYSGVSAQNIMDFNNIDGNLDVGQIIKIPKP